MDDLTRPSQIEHERRQKNPFLLRRAPHSRRKWMGRKHCGHLKSMPYRPRELVVRAREAAAVMLSALDRNEMVARFVDIYAAENRRPGRADQPSFYREQLQTIRRESILAIVLRIEAGLPARLKVGVTMRGAKPSKRRPAKLKKESAAAV